MNRKIEEFKIGNCEFELKHEIEEKDDEYIVKARLKIKKGSSKEKLIEDCFEKQTSPITQILTEKEKEQKRNIKRGENCIKIYNKNNN